MKPLPYIQPNKWHHRVINNLTCAYINAFSKPVVVSHAPVTVKSPLFITGFFRSGTSLVAHMMSELGYNLGPKQHLLSAHGTRKVLNPDGFYENYLFMEWSLYAFHHMNGWGHIPPTPQQVAGFNFPDSDHKKFVEFSVCGGA